MTTKKKLAGWMPPPPVIINTPWGQVTESARLRCALNMRDDPAVKARVEEVLCKQHGMARGLVESRRRYPEAYMVDVDPVDAADAARAKEPS
jgi:hypothetical protein